MEHQLGPLAGKSRFEAARVAHVAEDRGARHVGTGLGEVAVDPVEVVLGIVDQRQARRRGGGDLARELRADRAARAGDADALSLHQGAQRRPVQHGLGASEEVFQADLPHGDFVRVAGAEIGQRRQAGERKAEPLGRREQGANARRVGIPRRQDQPARLHAPRPQLPDDGRQLGGRAPDTDAVDVAFGLARVIVDDAHDAVAGRRAARGRPDEELGVVARPQQQNRNALGNGDAAPEDAAQAAVEDRPVEYPRPQKERDQDEPGDEEGRARIGLEPVQREQERQENQHGEAHGLHHQHHVAQCDVPPEPAVDSHAPEDERGDGREQQRPFDDEAARCLPERVVPPAEQQGEHERGAGHGRVVKRHRVGAVGDEA